MSSRKSDKALFNICAITVIITVVCLLATTSAQTQPKFTVSMETTYRPEYTESDSDSYSPIPLTPDLANIVDSVSAQPSVASAMNQARGAWGVDSTKDEL
ncbi:hypothetical protein IW140_003131 [Coemansia sp. RSA 1813]|nr:hypothetical protein EV178_003036 [Coemansia sp. RSA 1646]KAJ1768616.1 hypothetical protein LPJ74_004725 [Coemansia sp. RSA 1843]KAJ2089485.1 hypothetical protein IW138_003374 [Coemansia sp. RSA 986]KAJ2214545.1 hypothetical protein EV179_002950 [Coemansia sp. RSA 487]KAJ2569428.1 hypothetical protein IW140_003131 [Coemansia sp. RSA 1813]